MTTVRRRARHSLALVMAVGILSGGAACSGDDAPSSDPGPSSSVVTTQSGESSEPAGDGVEPVDACALLTDEEVGDALDGEVVHAETGPSGCEWHIEDAGAAQAGGRQILLDVGLEGTAPANRLAPESDYGPTTAIDGAGEGARISTGSIHVLEFPAGQRACQLQVVAPDGLSDPGQAATIAVPLAQSVRGQL